VSLAEYQQNRTPWVEGKFVRFDGQTIDVEMISVSNTYQGRPAAQMIFRDISERNQAKQRLEHLALYDALTGLPNRTLFFDRMEQLLTLAKRHGYILALLSLDLDHFKSINDSLGHVTGDLLLAEAAKRMMLCARKSDTIARMSGDEFIGVCGKITTPLDAALVAKKMLAALSEPFYLNGRACRVVASIGISIFPLDGEDVETLLSKAGAAMHSVKQAGKGGYAYTTPL
jgi:diguanylate cyclase (GGDEF)-like protein